MDSHADGMDKSEWRRRMAAARDAVPLETRVQWSERLCRNVESEILAPLRSRLGRQLTLCAYGAFRSEADPLPLARSCWRLGDTVAAPRMSNGSMELRVVRSPGDWRPGRWGVPEPDPSSTDALPVTHAPDVVLVPGLAFHPDGSRLGYGGGYYDRFYAAQRALGHEEIYWIGFAWSIQLTERPLPREPHDLRLDALVTEETVIWWSGGGQ
ncbi:5-formyltetrahydrofolate cyclo-ligase [Cohnella pontilimi]|uniref:5-formyltetrahydrofolate cyclo-ligase n=1 Tax=Cohnella pontilimi TaxID=2564100 RepID=A0A4V5LSE1_9BACL|nr:5-formyltetrahydrofolate cyclo-ligase [Cohnella pontilimi]TJY42719.1 5-formyltetrahydrofolate cyclo-ligase [Cohnella pontilimi]